MFTNSCDWISSSAFRDVELSWTITLTISEYSLVCMHFAKHFVCVTCCIEVLCIQADTGCTATLRLHSGGRWGWSYWRCQDDVIVVVEVVDNFGSFAPKWSVGERRGGRGEDSGELWPCFLSVCTHKHLCPYFHRHKHTKFPLFHPCVYTSTHSWF